MQLKNSLAYWRTELIMAETIHLHPYPKRASKAGAYPNEAPYDTPVYLLTNSLGWK
jgi:hypothetical protein